MMASQAYQNWINYVIKLNKDVIINGQSAINAMNAKNTQLTNNKLAYLNESLDYIKACQSEITGLMDKVNKHLLSNGKSIAVNQGLDRIDSMPPDINILRNEVQENIQKLRTEGGALLSKKPSKVNAGIAVLLFLCYLIPGIIYISVVNSNITNETNQYGEFCFTAQRLHSLLNYYQNALSNLEKQSNDLQKKNTDLSLSAIAQNLKIQSGATLVELQKFPSTQGDACMPWSSNVWKNWKPCLGSVPPLIRLGKLMLDGMPLNIEYPMLIPFQKGRGIFYKTSISGKSQALKSAKSIMLKLLLTTKPGKLEFTFVDPIGLGSSVSEFLSLADIDSDLIDKSVCSAQDQIFLKLKLLTEKIKTIQQVYLKTDFESIENYNESAKTIAEPYHIIFVMDFPVSMSEDSIRDLQSIAMNGPKCGIYPIIIARTPYVTHNVSIFSEIENNCTLIDLTENSSSIDDPRFRKFRIDLDESPDFQKDEMYKTAMTKIAELSLENKKVEYSYSEMLDKTDLRQENWWSMSTASSLEIPLGPSGARRMQNLKLGVDMQHSVLCIGRPGSGKSNLMQVMITTLALKYSPSEMQLYLIDMKSGVSFKPFVKYRLPHIKVVSIDSDRDFSLAVLEGLAKEIEVRGNKFRESDTETVADFRGKTGKKLPRILLLIDEFQDLFLNLNDPIYRKAEQILSFIIKEGRQVGVHMFLGTQSMAGIALDQKILDLIAVRIALQSGERELRTFLADDNTAAKLLKKPGEAIYNKDGGAIGSNTPFQIAYFSDDDKQKYLNAILDLSNKSTDISDSAIVFDGSKKVKIGDLSFIKSYLAGNQLNISDYPIGWVGKPLSTDESVSISFKKQTGCNLSIIDRDTDEGGGILLSVLISILAQKEMDTIINVISYSDPDSQTYKFLKILSEAYPSKLFFVTRRGLGRVIDSLASIEVASVTKDIECKTNRMLVIDGIHSARDLLSDNADEGQRNISDKFRKIIRNGPEIGIHTIIRSESYERYAEAIGSEIKEFDYRIAGSMDQQTSYAYIQDVFASQIEKRDRVFLYMPNSAGNHYCQLIPYSIPDETFIFDFINRKTYKKEQSKIDSKENKI